jgi:Tol biopolymer transport system component
MPRILSCPLAAGVLTAAVTLGACSSDPTSTSTAPELARSSARLSVSPSTLLLRTPGASRTFTATVQYSGVLTASSSNPACATVSPTSTTSIEKPQGSSIFVAQFTVTGVSKRGCTITVTDKKGNMASVRVSVSPIAFASDRDLPSKIYFMDADGQNPTLVTNAAHSFDFQPAWSPDGAKIAFSSSRDVDGDGYPDGLDIYVIDADGQNETRLTFDTLSSKPTWSPDGTKIAFDSERDGDPNATSLEIYVMDANGQNQTQLTNNSASLTGEPAWSPDGTKIAFFSNRDAFLGEIYVMDVSGGNVKRLTFTSGGNWAPAWSPDGTKIAFSSGRVAGQTEQIYVMDADGQNQIQLTNGFLRSTLPAWSPDGTRIAFDGQIAEHDIYVMDADGQNLARLTHAEPFTNNQFPAWR